MSGSRKSIARLLERHKSVLSRELDPNSSPILRQLIQKGVLSRDEERVLLLERNLSLRTELFVDILSNKGFNAFRELCLTLEMECPHLLTSLLLDSTARLVLFGNLSRECQADYAQLMTSQRRRPRPRSVTDTPTIHSRRSITPSSDYCQRHYIQKLNDSSKRHSLTADGFAAIAHSRESSTLSQAMMSPKCNNRDLEMNRTPSSSSVLGGYQSLPIGGSSTGLEEASSLHLSANKVREKLQMLEDLNELLEEPVEEQGGERIVWEYHQVLLERVPGYGFGIAVSGGRDNPHFTNGDPSIAISDVLKAGPAEGKLLINDRVISANNVSLEGVDYATAVQVLRDSGQTVNLVVKRRVVLPPTVPPPGQEPKNLRVSLSRSKKKEDFGVVLGCKIYIKEIVGRTVADKDGTLQEGDLVHKLNGTPVDGLTLKEARKLVETAKERLDLVVRRPGHHEAPRKAVNGDIGAAAKNNYSAQNIYVQPAATVEAEKNNLAKSSAGMYGPVEESGGPPPRPPLPVDEDYGTTRRQQNPQQQQQQPQQQQPQQQPQQPQPSNGAEETTSISDRNKGNLPDPRFISFQKAGSVGIRLTGGNEVGIFVTAVQPGSPAAQQGLQPGDKILKVNDMDMKGVTREEAVLFLLSLQDQINLIAQYRRDEYDQIVSLQRGDSFYIRAHFSHQQPDKGEMAFTKSDVFHVVDTLHNGVVGAWQVFRMDPFLSGLGRAAEQVQKGVIPNKARAEEIATQQFNAAKKEQNSIEQSRGTSFFRRKRDKASHHRRSKSLGKGEGERLRAQLPPPPPPPPPVRVEKEKPRRESSLSRYGSLNFRMLRSRSKSKSKTRDEEMRRKTVVAATIPEPVYAELDHWEDLVWSESMSKFPAYERVSLRHPGFPRPVVIFGPVADLARERLLRDFPGKFASPQQDSPVANGNDAPKSAKSGIVRLSSIREIMNRGKHALLDVTPNAVDKLNYAQFYPIVIFARADSKQTVKDCRNGVPKKSHMSSKKLLEQCQKLEKLWPHVFTARLNLTNITAESQWYNKLTDLIDKQQTAPIWMSESKPDESVADDFLFPMTSRLSYASSPESDGEFCEPETPTRNMSRQPSAEPSTSRLARSNSDPSLANPLDGEEGAKSNIDSAIPDYNAPPPYAVNLQQHSKDVTDTSTAKRRSHGGDSKYGFNGSTSYNSPTSHGATTAATTTTSINNESVDELPLPPHPNGSNSSSLTQTPTGTNPRYASMPVSTSSHDKRSQSQPPSANNSSSSNRVSPPRQNGDVVNSGMPHVPPKIDRQKKPSRSSSREYPYNGSTSNSLDRQGHVRDMKMSVYDAYDPYNTHDPHPDPATRNTNPRISTNGSSHYRSVYSSPPSHNGYDYGRSPANRALSSNFPPNGSSSSYRYTDYKPVPPPKSTAYKPVPPPKPKSYPNRPVIQNGMGQPPPGPPGPGSLVVEGNYMNSGAGPPASLHYHSSSTFVNGHARQYNDDDSGQGSSLDRDYGLYNNAKPVHAGQQQPPMPPSNNSRGQYYYNVPPGEQQANNSSPRRSTGDGLDLSKREYRGSAFELYKKPLSEARGPGQPQQQQQHYYNQHQLAR